MWTQQKGQSPMSEMTARLDSLDAAAQSSQTIANILREASTPETATALFPQARGFLEALSQAHARHYQANRQLGDYFFSAEQSLRGLSAQISEQEVTAAASLRG